MEKGPFLLNTSPSPPLFFSFFIEVRARLADDSVRLRQGENAVMN